MSKSDFFNHYQMMYRLYTNPLDIPFYIEKNTLNKRSSYKKRSTKSKKSRKSRGSYKKRSTKSRKYNI